MKVDIVYKNYSEITPYKKNPKKHPKEQIQKLVNSIKEFGFNSPLVIDKDNVIICGHARYESLGQIDKNSEVPCILLETLTPSQIKAYRIADNKIASLGSWDENFLVEELKEIKLDNDIDAEILGFEQGELDVLLKPLADEESEKEDEKEDIYLATQLGDIWVFDGKHKLLCGDSLIEENYKILFGEKKANLCFSDPPYNMSSRDILHSKRKNMPKNFYNASGEMKDDEFVKFLHSYISFNVQFSEKNTLFYYCINWQKQEFISQAGKKAGFDLKNVCVWVKPNGGIGFGLYRNKYELIYVYSLGGSYVNNVKFGSYGRSRFNVWEYGGVTNNDRQDHPTIKPLQMVIDIILDASKYNDIVLDSFMGSGTTLHACQASDRVGYGIEYDCKYVDVSIKRFQRYYPNAPIVLLETGETFEEVKKRRCNNV